MLVVAGGVLVIVLGLLWLPLSLLVRVAKVLSAALSRAGEHAADRHAAELGYGPGLVQVLLLFQQAEFAAPRPLHGRAAAQSSHLPGPHRRHPPDCLPLLNVRSGCIIECQRYIVRSLHELRR